MSVAIIAALPREVNALVRGWERHIPHPGRVVLYTNGDAVVAYAGMGMERAALAAEAAMAAMPVMALISAGLAGACDPQLRAGAIVRTDVVFDAQTGEAFGNSQHRQVLVTTDAIASVGGKARLHSVYKAHAVDLEAAAIARLAQAHGLRFQAIKAISDEADFEIEELSRFATAAGQFRETAFALHAALRPAMWDRVLTLGRNSHKALKALTKALQCELDLYKEKP
jgi:adenosylhomocysteine nucleosidase